MEVYSSVRSGEVSGSLTSKQLPDIGNIRMVQFYAPSTNSGTVYIGSSNGVTVPDGTTTTTAGIPLSAGGITPLLPILNLSHLAMICGDSADDSVVYFAIG